MEFLSVSPSVGLWQCQKSCVYHQTFRHLVRHHASFWSQTAKSQNSASNLLSVGAKHWWFRYKICFSTNVAVYVANGTYGIGPSKALTGSYRCLIERYHVIFDDLQWPRKAGPRVGVEQTVEQGRQMPLRISMQGGENRSLPSHFSMASLPVVRLKFDEN